MSRLPKCVISSVFNLKYQYSYFPSHFGFLEVSVQLFFLPFLFLVFVVFLFDLIFSLLLVAFFALFNIFIESLYWCTKSILNSGNSTSSFFSWNIESMSSLVCKVLCIAINFLVLWLICSSLVHLKNRPDYLTRSTAQVFNLLIRFLQLSLVSTSFPDLRYCFLISLIVFTSSIPRYKLFSCSPRVFMLSWFGSSIPSGVSLFLLFIVSTAYLKRQIQFLYPDNLL